MARNKRDQDADLKREQIEDAACVLFLQQGYEATSMAAVAKSAGVAPNTLYWYFEGKDELLVAVMDRLVNRALGHLASEMHSKPLSAQLAWMLAEFQQANKLIATVHARLDQSPQIHAWHERFHAMLDDLLVKQLTQSGMSRSKASLMATVGTYVVEGLLSHPHTSQQFDKVVQWLLGSGKA